MFHRVVQKLDHWISHASLTLMLVSGVMILLMAWGETYGVVKRYVFHAPDPFAYELSTMFLLFCGVLAVAGVELLDRHVRNDLVASRFPQGMKFVALRIIFPILALFFVAVLTWKSFGDAMYALEIGKVSQSTWKLPLAPIKFVIPAGYILLCLVLIGKFCQGIALLKGGKYRDQTE
jgi:TRAP-type mannitol/chloroaromatic compound transport system permease small subunit